MADWIRRPYSAPGVTQSPPGPYLRAVQAKYGGTVLLCVDVSGSMYGEPLREAVRGALRFVDEAVAAHYAVGVILWNHRVEAEAEAEPDGKAARTLLDEARSGGGTRLMPALERCHAILGERPGDRVVALFSDGGVSDRPKSLAKVAEMKAGDIRFVTCGLGEAASEEFGEFSSEDPSRTAIPDVSGLADGIAGMAKSLGRPGAITGRPDS